ncbi:MAG: type II CAAX endopeptidase family protein [Woeseia sp.]
MQDASHPTFRVSVTAIVLFQVAALFARSMLELSLRAQGMGSDVANDLSYLVVPPILMILTFPYLRTCKDSLRKLFSVADLTIRVTLLSIALGLIMRLTYWASLTLLIGTGVIGNEDPNAIVGPLIGFDCPPAAVFLLSLAIMAVVVPVTEEVMHRGFFLFGLLSRGKNLAIILSAIYFALMHELSTYLPAFIVGLVLAVQVLNFRALWGPIITHATYNATATIDWDCFQLIWNPPAGDPTIVKLAWASIPIIIAGVTLSLLIVREKRAGAS